MTDRGPRQRSAYDLLERGYVQGGIGAMVGLIFTGLLQGRGDLPGGLHITLLGMAAGFGLMMGIARLLARAGGGAATAIYNPSGNTTAYVPTHSHIDALTIRGDLDGAAVAWDAMMHEQPQSMGVVVRAADFHLRERKDAETALGLFLRARALAAQAQAGTNIADLHRYVQQKLVDLYLEGPQADEGRALVELRRLIDGFPGSREAEHARASLSELKARRGSGNMD